MFNLVDLIPYFAAFISLLFLVAIGLTLGERIASDIDKSQKEKIKQK